MIPAFEITADDKNITELIASRLISLNITDETGLASDICEILLDNRDYALEIPPRGAVLKIALGYEEILPLASMGSYIVNEICCSALPLAQMRITARAVNTELKGLNRKIKSPKSRSWHQITLSKIIEIVASENNLVSFVDRYFEAIHIPHLDQTDESDISFLTSIASDYGAFVKLALGKLLFFRRGISISQSGKELPIITLSENQISNYRLSITNEQEYGRVIANWHNFATGKEEEVWAGESGDSGNSRDSENGKDGDENSNDNHPAYHLRYSFRSKEAALIAAKAKLAEFKRGAERLNLSTTGNPALSAENKIIVEGIKYLQNKSWVIESVNHELSSENGFISHVSASRLLQISN